MGKKWKFLSNNCIHTEVREQWQKLVLFAMCVLVTELTSSSAASACSHRASLPAQIKILRALEKFLKLQ